MDLTTKYMGLTLKNPIVPAASPLSKGLDGIRQLEDAGAPAIVMFSLFEEQVTLDSYALDHYLSYGTDSFGEAQSYLPDAANYNIGPDEYLNLLSKAKQATNIPIVGSLNGISKGGWTNYARLMELAGADGLELNIYYVPTDAKVPGTDIERMYVDVLRDVLWTVKIPVAVKMSPYFSSTAYMARRLAEAGANALVMFNRFYQPDFDLQNLEVVPSLELSRAYELRLPLHWVAILHGQVPLDYAITSGVHSHEDVLKSIMAGASIVQVASELLHHGPERLKEMLDGMTRWMEEFEYQSVNQMKGSMNYKNVGNAGAYERTNYMKVLQSYRNDPTGQMPK